MTQSKLPWLSILALCWLVIGGLLTLGMWPDLPSSNSGWFILLAFGPPIFVFGEAFFGWLLSPRHGAAVSQNRFSALRILLAFPLAVAWFAFCWWLSWLISH
jgi:hypothetical protein